MRRALVVMVTIAFSGGCSSNDEAPKVAESTPAAATDTGAGSGGSSVYGQGSGDTGTAKPEDAGSTPDPTDTGTTAPLEDTGVADVAQPDVQPTDAGAKVEDTGPGPDVQPDPNCGYGVVVGVVCSPSQQVFVNGATVTVDTVDCDGKALHLETKTDDTGKYTLTGVPTGTQKIAVQSADYTNDYSVIVNAGETTDISSMGYKACPQAFDKCATGSVKGNVCTTGEPGPKGNGKKVFVETQDCHGDPVYLQTYSNPIGDFLLSGIPVGTQIVRIETGTMLALATALIEPNKATDMGYLGKIECKEPPCTVENGCKEACDCLDNDGDGTVDEGCGIFWTLSCIDGCNCVDDDGDGQIDEDCTTSTMDCGKELCNCVDDDGDGKIDESCCLPGDVRFCDENIYCAWGKQTCKEDGSWSKCLEISPNDIPGPCQPYYDFDEEVTIYDKSCCVSAGFCCQDYPEWESIGNCSESPCK